MNKLDSPENVNTYLTDVEKFVDRYSLGRDNGDGSRQFLRVKIPNGILTAWQFRQIGQLAEKYGKGYAEITDRQDIQLHWIEPENALEIFAKLDEIGFTTDKCGQGFPGARYGDVRNIVGCPLAGVDRFELMDASPLVKELNRFFTGNKDFLDLPRKFKITVSGCSLNCTNPEAHDLSFVALRHPTGRVGFAMLVGGTVGVTPRLAQSLEVFVEPSDVINVTKAIVEIYRDYGRRDVKAKARFRWLVEEWGTEKLRKTVEEKIGRTFETYKLDHFPVSEGEHIGVQPQKQEGYSYINIPILGGMLTTDKMLNIAEVAERYGSGDLRLTPYQNIIIINIPRDQVASAVNRLEQMGFQMDGSPFRWTTVACAGNFCGKTPEHPKKRAVEIIGYLEERLGGALKNLNLRICISGCPNGCARHLTADIGMQAARLVVNGKPMACYNIYVGSNAALGKLIKRAVPADNVKYEIESLITAYIKSRTSLESFRDFYNRQLSEGA